MKVKLVYEFETEAEAREFLDRDVKECSEGEITSMPTPPEVKVKSSRSKSAKVAADAQAAVTPKAPEMPAFNSQIPTSPFPTIPAPGVQQNNPFPSAPVQAPVVAAPQLPAFDRQGAIGYVSSEAAKAESVIAQRLGLQPASPELKQHSNAVISGVFQQIFAELQISTVKPDGTSLRVSELQDNALQAFCSKLSPKMTAALNGVGASVQQTQNFV